MTLEDIYFECEQKGITVDYFKTDKAKAFSFPYDNLLKNTGKLQDPMSVLRFTNQ